jgi:demethylsterigmatocystin 6-O-methyltransferase
MGPDSKILVDDIVMPGKDAHWYAVGLDMLMMSLLGARERTEKQWNALFESVGLKISNKYVYDSVKGDAVLEVVPA